MNKINIILASILTLLFLRASWGANEPPATHRYMKVTELRERLLKGEHITVIDARSAYAYRMEHLKDAISIPLAEVKTQMTEHPLPKDALIVTYCSCPHHIAEMAGDILKSMGYTNLYVLDEGLPGWKKLAYPLEGELANQPINVYWLIGYVYGPFHKPRPEVEVRVYQPRTDQLEFDKTGSDGFYAIPLRFYGLKEGDQLQASFGGDIIFFTVEKMSKPWGIRVDDEESHISLLQDQFLKTFKAKKLH